MINHEALELLNKHLDQVVTIGGKQYSREKVARVYAKLNPQDLSDSGLNEFYKGQRVRARISEGNFFAPNSVQFQTHYPETGWTVKSPLEQGIESSTPAPIREIAQMYQAFDNLQNHPQAKILYSNEPLSEHRAKAYEKRGFSPVDEQGIQYLDNRRFQNLPTIKQMYDMVPRKIPLTAIEQEDYF